VLLGQSPDHNRFFGEFRFYSHAGGHMWLQCCSVWAENLKYEADVSVCILRDNFKQFYFRGVMWVF